MLCVFWIISVLFMSPHKVFVRDLNKTILVNKEIGEGYDARYPFKKTHTSMEEDWDMVFRIQKKISKMRLLKYLNDTNNSESEKLAMLEKYDHYYGDPLYKPNISKGGLYDDWNNFLFYK